MKWPPEYKKPYDIELHSPWNPLLGYIADIDINLMLEDIIAEFNGQHVDIFHSVYFLEIYMIVYEMK